MHALARCVGPYRPATLPDKLGRSAADSLTRHPTLRRMACSIRVLCTVWSGPPPVTQPHSIELPLGKENDRGSQPQETPPPDRLAIPPLPWGRSSAGHVRQKHRLQKAGAASVGLISGSRGQPLLNALTRLGIGRREPRQSACGRRMQGRTALPAAFEQLPWTKPPFRVVFPRPLQALNMLCVQLSPRPVRLRP